MSSDTPRIVIQGVGQFGSFVTRLATQKGWPVVAAFDLAGPKVGQDLGDVAGVGRKLGVIVQDGETADYSVLDADIAIVAQTNQLKINLPAYRRLMGAGINVLCHGGESYFPYGNDKALAAEIDALARDNGVTFTGSGIWDMTRIWAGILAAGPCTRIDALVHGGITNIEGQTRDAAQARMFGPGQSEEEFAEKAPGLLPNLVTYKTIPEQVLDALGYTITGTSVDVEPVRATAPVESAMFGQTFAPGAIIGTRTVGRVETREGVTGRCKIELRLFYPGDSEHTWWRVDGVPGTQLRIERSDPAHTSAATLLNRIPDVIAAPPGIVPISKLGPMKPVRIP